MKFSPIKKPPFLKDFSRVASPDLYSPDLVPVPPPTSTPRRRRAKPGRRRRRRDLFSHDSLDLARVDRGALEAGRAGAGLGAAAGLTLAVSPGVRGSLLGARGGGPRQVVASAGLSVALRRVQAAVAPVRGRWLHL